jgi:hypothetical protein
MIQLKVNYSNYDCISSFSEMTIKDAQKLHKEFKKMPKVLRERYRLVAEGANENDIVKWADALTEQNEDDIIDFYRKSIALLTNIPTEIIEATNEDSIINIFYQYIDYFVFGLLYHGAGIKPVKITHFIHNKELYHLPDDREMGEVVVPFESMTSIQFTEAADLFALLEHDYIYAAYIVATLTLDQSYDEDLVIERAKKLQDLPMDVVFDVFFCFHSTKATYESVSNTFLNRVREEVQMQNGGAYYWISTKSLTTNLNLN